MSQEDGTQQDPQASSKSNDAGESVEAVQLTAIVGHADFEEFYRVQRDSVARALALTLRDPHLAADAADEAMTRAYQHWRSVSRYDNPAGWAYRVGLNWAISRLRKQRREVRGFRLEDRGAEDRPIDDPAVIRALSDLPIEQRSVVVLRYYLDWSTEDVATALGIPVGTVKSRLHRALEHLSHKLETST